MSKVYLGDSVYAEQHEWGLVLTTENGMGASNTIVLEPEVFASMIEFSMRDSDAELQVKKDCEQWRQRDDHIRQVIREAMEHLRAGAPSRALECLENATK